MPRTMRLSQEQKDLLASLSTNYKTGRPQWNNVSAHDDDLQDQQQQDHELNIISPPLNCPKWACIILPCINHIPSMKLFKSIVPREAEVRIGSRWVCYDASSLNRGDIVRLTEGDIIPADLVLLSLGTEFASEEDVSTSVATHRHFHEESLELIVDSSQINGESKPQIISLNPDKTVNAAELFAGSVVLHGEAIAVVTKIGDDVLLSRLIKEGKWPQKRRHGWQAVNQNDNDGDDDDDADSNRIDNSYEENIHAKNEFIGSSSHASSKTQEIV